MDLTHIVALVFALVPAPYRPLAETILSAVIAAQMIDSAIVAQMPSRWAELPGWRGLVVRAMHRFGHMRFRDEAGTLKLPGARLIPSATVAELMPPAGVYRTPTLPYATVAPAPHGSRASSPPSTSADNGQRGSSSIAALLVAGSMVIALALGAAVFGGLVGCRPQPVPTDGAVNVTPSAWTNVARTVLSVLGYAVPGARLILATLPIPEPAKTLIDRALDVVATYAQRLGNAIDAYESRGGDACPAHAAVAGLRSALVDLARVLADNGIALGRPLEQVLDSVAGIADQLVEGCEADAGWRSYGVESNDELRAIVRSAESRGVILRRDLDAIRAPAAQ